MILKNGKRIDGCTDTLPVGTVQPFLGLTPPLGYLVCQGQLVSKVEYPELYNICKSTFGAETETHFYLPDLRGKTIAGYDSSDTTMNTIGKLLGNKTHTHTSAAHTHTIAGHTHSTGNHTLTVDEIPSHNHRFEMGIYNTSGGGWYNAGLLGTDGGGLQTSWGTDGAVKWTGGNGAHNHGNTGSTSLTTDSTTPNATGSNTNFQPTITMNWIVKAAMLIPEYFKVDNTLTSTSTSNALSAAQGKILNDKFNNYLPQSKVADNLTTTDSTSALSAKQGKLLNDTLWSIHNHSHALRTGIYMQGTSGGALITFDNANLYNMMQVRLWGNGYGANPVDTIVQGYHYEYVGNFIQCKQHNNSAGLGACKWKIINGKIALWVPYLVHYSSLVIDAYETLPQVRPIPTTVELMGGEPAGDASVACTIV